ncbi:hypothetical protein KIPB_007873, partial [Kipferlia bialata]
SLNRPSLKIDREPVFEDEDVNARLRNVFHATDGKTGTEYSLLVYSEEVEVKKLAMIFHPGVIEALALGEISLKKGFFRKKEKASVVLTPRFVPLNDYVTAIDDMCEDVAVRNVRNMLMLFDWLGTPSVRGNVTIDSVDPRLFGCLPDGGVVLVGHHLLTTSPDDERDAERERQQRNKVAKVICAYMRDVYKVFSFGSLKKMLDKVCANRALSMEGVLKIPLLVGKGLYPRLVTMMGISPEFERKCVPILVRMLPPHFDLCDSIPVATVLDTVLYPGLMKPELNASLLEVLKVPLD